jgi:hypothetical protein
MPVLLLGGVVLAIGVLLWITFARKKPGPPETFEESEENE